MLTLQESSSENEPLKAGLLSEGSLQTTEALTLCLREVSWEPPMAVTHRFLICLTHLSEIFLFQHNHYYKLMKYFTFF